MKLIYLSAFLSPLFLTTAFAEETYFRLKPAEQILKSTPTGEIEKIYVDIRSAPGSWRENEAIHFSINTIPNSKIRVKNLPGTLEYNESLRSVVGTSSAGSAPYNYPFTVYAEGLTYSEAKTFDLSIYPEITPTIENYIVGRVGRAFNSNPSVSGIVGSQSWSINSNVPGLSVNSVNGAIYGVPTHSGTYSGLILSVQDSIDKKSASTRPFTVEIEPDQFAKVLSSGTNVNVQSYFSPEEWQSDIPKVAIVPEGSIIGSTDPTKLALYSGSDWGGSLTLKVAGSVQGAGGNPNGGVGGTAILSQDSRLNIDVTGSILSGGGGGGRGGVGGTSTETVWVDDTGWLRNPTYAWAVWRSRGTLSIWWVNSFLVNHVAQPSGNQMIIGQYRYLKGNWTNYTANGADEYEIKRQVKSTKSFNGGGGGEGGRGEGYQSPSTNGSNGYSGTGIAGRGGNGGSGGAAGSNGASGEAGQAGNAGSGTSGSGGGLAGYAVDGAANITNNNATILGR